MSGEPFYHSARLSENSRVLKARSRALVSRNALTSASGSDGLWGILEAKAYVCEWVQCVHVCSERDFLHPQDGAWSYPTAAGTCR